MLPAIIKFVSLAITGLLLATSAHAQLRVEIAGVGATQIPVAVATFADEATAPQKISEIIKADLARSGYFKIVDAGGAVLSETAPIDYNKWRASGANALVVGSIEHLADGRFDVRYRLIDPIKSADLSGLSLTTQPQFLRVPAHQIADDIYQKLLGVPGVFATRIAYITKLGHEYHLEIADSDGDGAQVALRSAEPIISPTWSPDGTHLAYVSFESKKPVVYIQDLVNRQRTVIANYKGSNSAPAWSPDGSKLAIALSREGLTQIFLVNADGTDLRQLTTTQSINTEPRFSPDGQTIYFTSDRSGGPQVYRMSVGGGEAQRITFNGNYNISPRISPDGKTLAYVSRREGKFQLYKLDLTNNQEIRLSDTDYDESPSFAPNGRYIMYATGLEGHESLAVVSTDGLVKQTLSTKAGDIREPTWGPFMK